MSMKLDYISKRKNGISSLVAFMALPDKYSATTMHCWVKNYLFYVLLQRRCYVLLCIKRLSPSIPSANVCC